MIIDLMPHRSFVKGLLFCSSALIVGLLGLFLLLLFFTYNNIFVKVALIVSIFLCVWLIMAIMKFFIGKFSHLDMKAQKLFIIKKGFFAFRYQEFHFYTIDLITLNVCNHGTKRGDFYRVLVELDHQEFKLGDYNIKNDALMIVEKLSKYFNATVSYTATNYLFETMDKTLLNPQYHFSSMPNTYLVNGLIFIPFLYWTLADKTLYFGSGIFICLIVYYFYLYYQSKKNLREISDIMER